MLGALCKLCHFINCVTQSLYLLNAQQFIKRMCSNSVHAFKMEESYKRGIESYCCSTYIEKAGT